MTKAQRSRDSREKLLAAAENVVLEKGIANLTLDAVASAAGISKGGLLYHFASKEALVVGLVEKLVAGIEVDLQAAYDAEPAGPGRAARAAIAETVSRTGQAREERRERIGAALLAAAGNNPELLEPMRKAFTVWMKQIGDDGLAPGVSLVVAAALDGFTFWQIFGLYSPTKAAIWDAVALLKQLAAQTR